MPPTFIDNGVTVEHPLELKFNAPAWDILSAIEQGSRAQTDVKGIWRSGSCSNISTS